MRAFNTPADSLGKLDAEAAAMLIAVASDLALVLDDQGVILDVSFHGEDLARDLDLQSSWPGRKWADTVSVDSRPKVEALLRDAAEGAPPRWRHLNHPVGQGPHIPILYAAVRVGDDGRTVAFGRDLRAMSELQQRLVDAQQSLEQDYSRLRHVEMRYRLLFQMSSEAVLIVDAATLRIMEANPAAHRLFGDAARRMLGRYLPQAFDAAGAEAVQALLNTVRAVGRADEVRARLDGATAAGNGQIGHGQGANGQSGGEAGGGQSGSGQSDGGPADSGQSDGGPAGSGRQVMVSASLFREDKAALFLVRVAPDDGQTANAVLSRPKSLMLRLVENAPDGFVVIGTDGRVITANAAFLELAQLSSEEQARGETLDRWLGRQSVDLDVLIANLRQRGSVRLFATVVRGEYGSSTDVEVSAVTVMNGGQPCYGFTTRTVSRRLPAEPADVPHSVEHLAELIGRVSLKELVRQSTDVIERLCIETALKMTGDNRASAAEMLGLSRQSFYVKLRRHGLGDLAPEGGDL